MRKTMVGQFFTLCALFIGLCILPVSSSAADTVKFGSIDVQKVLNESDAGKKAKSDLESLIKSKQSTIDERGKAIDKMRSDIEKQASVLSAEARKSKDEELEKQIREYQRLVQDSQAEIKKKEAELTDTILKDIKEMVDTIGQAEGYSLIIEKGMVLYSDKGIDITDNILKKYDESKAKSQK